MALQDQIEIGDDTVIIKNSNGDPILIFANLHYQHPVVINANNLNGGRQYDFPDVSGVINLEE